MSLMTGPTAGPLVAPEQISGVASMNTQRHQNGTDMNQLNADLARAHQAQRLDEAQSLRAGHQLARARRLSRKAERAAQQARLALARAL